MKQLLTIILLLASTYVHAGKKLRVLFIGNSYTQVNNLPQVLENIANAAGDTLEWQMEAPGGYTLQGHCSTAATINKIKLGNWNYVVLQEQSQTPALPNDFVATGFFPYVRQLDSIIDQYNPCAQTVFYRTWGRKYSDNQLCQQYTIDFNWPHYCSYAAMDSVLQLRYMMAADSIKGAVAPAGAVWRYIRTHYPNIDLYDPDESHPSQAGTYAAALSFYTALYRKDPVTHTATYNYSLDTATANAIRTAARKVAYDSMQQWHIGQHELQAALIPAFQAGSAHIFAPFNLSVNATNQVWYYGDGLSSANPNGIHSYSSPGIYTVMLVATNQVNGCKDTAYATIEVKSTGTVPGTETSRRMRLFPNPAGNIIHIEPGTQGEIRQISISEISGKILYTETLSQNAKTAIDISMLQAGMYVMKCVTDSGHVLITKFAKK